MLRPRCLLPLALWFLATFFLLGSLGFWTDDYYYIQRDPTDGSILALYLDRPIHFWRPLYKATVPPLLTLFYQRPWFLHLLVAAAHGLVCVLLYRLLLVLGTTRQAASIAALFFLVYPAHFEPVFWIANLPTTLACALVLASFLAIVRWARAPGSVWTPLAMAPLFFGISCFNEQPACAAGAIPFLYLAARPDAEPFSRTLRRAIAPAIPAALGVAAYTALHIHFIKNKPALGYDSYMVPPSKWLHQIAFTARWALETYRLSDFARYALRVGIGTLAAHPWRATVMLLILMVSVPAWLAHHARIGHERLASPGSSRFGAIALFGLAFFVSTWVPILAFNYWLNPRVCYPPDLGLAVLLAAAISFAARRAPLQPLRRGHTRRLIAGVAALALLIPAAVVMVGVQTAYQRRAAQDAAEIESLRALFPDPPPGAVFIPAMMHPPTLHAHAGRYDYFFWSALSAWWSARWAIRLHYHRADLDSGIATWYQSAIHAADADGLTVYGAGNGTARVPWSLAIPFEVLPGGEIAPVSTIRVSRPGHPSADYPVPLTTHAAEAAHTPARTFTISH